MKITCQKCSHEWITKSKYKYVSCPSCLTKVKNPNHSPSPKSSDSDRLDVIPKDESNSKVSPKTAEGSGEIPDDHYIREGDEK